MTLNNKKKSVTKGFHTVKISHQAFLCVKSENLEEYKKGNAENIGETLSRIILAGTGK